MDRETFATQIETLAQRRPFRPYTVTLVTGQQLEVDSPLALAHREGVSILIGPRGVPHFLDHKSVSHIVGDLADKTAAD